MALGSELDDRVMRVVDAAAVFDLGGVCCTPTFAARGAMGEVWRVETATGVWAVKILFPWNEPGACPPDVAIQEAAAAVGVRVPTITRSVEGDVVATVAGRGVRVYEWVDLDVPLEVPIAEEMVADAGWILGRIHSLPTAAPADPIDDWYTIPPSRDEWEALVGRADAAGAAWAARLAANVDAMVDLDHMTAGDPGPVIFGHRDFDPSNVLRRRRDGRLVVLDWENAGAIPADWELASALDSWTGADPMLVAALIDGYRRGGGTALVTGPTSFRSETTAFCNYVRVLVRNVLDDGEEAVVSRPQLERILGRGIHGYRPRIEALLRALG
jgi:aminoglycoside phosphotransferase (APT) family kinase protein